MHVQCLVKIVDRTTKETSRSTGIFPWSFLFEVLFKNSLAAVRGDFFPSSFLEMELLELELVMVCRVAK